MDVLSVKEFPEEGPRVPLPVNVAAYLAKEASMSLHAALVPFYGCSRCRHSRKGCISWNCNPVKLKEHFDKFPEKYEGKTLRPSSWEAISAKELEGIPEEAIE